MEETNLNENLSAIKVIVHHIKDLSFEIQHPLKFREKLLNNNQSFTPEIKLDIQVKAKKIQKSKEQDIYEVGLDSKVGGLYETEKIFLLELLYNGLFVFDYDSKEQLEELCMVHAPTLMFPYVRNIISEVTANGGITPLFLSPIDFQRLYMAKKMQPQAIKN